MRDEAPIVHVFNFQTNIRKSLMCLKVGVISKLRTRAIEHVEKRRTPA